MLDSNVRFPLSSHEFIRRRKWRILEVKHEQKTVKGENV